MTKFEVWAENCSSVTAILWDFTSRQKPFWSLLHVSYSSVNWDLFGIQSVAQGYFLFGQPLLAFQKTFQRINWTFRVLDVPLILIYLKEVMDLEAIKTGSRRPNRAQICGKIAELYSRHLMLWSFWRLQILISFGFMVGYLALLPMFSVIKDVCKVTRASPQNSYSEMSHWNAAAATVLHGAGLISSPQRVRLISPTEGLPSSQCT